MEKIIYVEKVDFHNSCKKEVMNMNSLMDIGCGIMPQLQFYPKVHICVEPFKEYMEVLMKKLEKDIYQDREWVFIQKGFSNVLGIIPDKSIDTICMIDVIEHIEKEEVLHSLEKMIKKVRKQVIIVTPLGFMPQEHEGNLDAWGLNGAEQQKHVSGWEPKDFKDENWKFVICERYHTHDNLGQPLDKTYGILFAIYTNPQYNRKNSYQKGLTYFKARLYRSEIAKNSYRFIKNALKK